MILGVGIALYLYMKKSDEKNNNPPPPSIPPSPSIPPLPPPGSSDRSNFRIVPLSFYTPDGRNDQYFTDSSYGVRVAWIGRTSPPGETFTVGGRTYSWAQRGTVDTKKGNDWPSALSYVFTDIGAPPGPQTIVVGTDSKYTYNVLIPSAVHSADSDILFIGDVQTQGGNFGLTGVSDVIVDVLSKAKDTSLVVFPGDIFYHNTAYIMDTAWSSSSEGLMRGSRPITDFLVVAVPGNHDYDALGCGECNFRQQQKGSLLCTTALSRANALWVPIFFVTDAMKSFNDGLADVGESSCAVPIQYTLQIYVIGSTCLILVDNVWHPSESDQAVGGDWTKVANRLPPSVTTILVSSHWDGVAMGAVSDTLEWGEYLKSKFPGRRVICNTNHTHTNTVLSGDPGVAKSGGNGFHGAGCSCTGACRGCACCCPSMWTKDQQWIQGGWSSGQLCSQLLSSTNGGGQQPPSHHDKLQSTLQATPNTEAIQLAAFNSNKHVPLSAEEAIQWFAPPFIVDDAVYRRKKGPFEKLKQLHPTWNPNAAAVPLTKQRYPKQIRTDPRIVEAYDKTYGMKDGYPNCKNLAVFFPDAADPGFTCWTDEVHPQDVFYLADY